MKKKHPWPSKINPNQFMNQSTLNSPSPFGEGVGGEVKPKTYVQKHY